ncbi:hypothetical protein CSV80_06890 [Sporosarcina sp. P12(2017)]|nr:hypothetical protein CSV81_07210 [Sporosarcina sp. P10]PIC61208.1 hypothetical protein CSV80_06890 [Sporosarcina sp. P12(2017)]
MDSVPFLGDVFTRMGIWVLIATSIAAYSQTALRAAIHTLLFFLGKLTGYYLYSAHLFGVYSTNDMKYWGIVAVVTPFLALAVWYAKHGRCLACFLPALTMGLMLSLSLGIGLFYLDVNYLEEFIMYIILCVIFYRNSKQLTIVIVLSVMVISVIELTPLFWFFIF